jgi:hypothetical protein
MFLDGWMGGSKSRFKDCLQQSKIIFLTGGWVKPGLRDYFGAVYFKNTNEMIWKEKSA